jgi:hypothetical protein
MHEISLIRVAPGGRESSPARQARGFIAGNQESAGGERGEPERTGAVWSRDPVKNAGACPQPDIGQTRALAAPEIAGPRSALKGHSVQCEG